MKIYLVGGAVRDQLLDYPIKERDWVVVGGTPDVMKKQGYHQVGRGFPVFLHPTTHEEYALARKERKSAPGYYGFDCDIASNITLEDDLLRRDLTINAMAMDEDGNIIDPYHGLVDLQEKKLRHISLAFVEDPIRVLRVARFAARYYHLGFKVADETCHLMYQMVKRGELAHLVPERVWQELQRSLQEKNPEIFISTLRSCGALNVVLPEIDSLFGVPNPRRYHPEVDSGVHTLLVLQAAVERSNNPMVRFAALVHDLGKAVTLETEWPSHHGHEESGTFIIDSLCQRLRIPVAWRKFAMMAARFHLIIHRLFELRAKTILKVLTEVDAFRCPQQFDNMLVVCEADAQGRKHKIDYYQAKKWRYMLDESLKVSVHAIIKEGYQNMAIKHELQARRLACISLIVNSWKQKEHEE